MNKLSVNPNNESNDVTETRIFCGKPMRTLSLTLAVSALLTGCVAYRDASLSNGASGSPDCVPSQSAAMDASPAWTPSVTPASTPSLETVIPTASPVAGEFAEATAFAAKFVETDLFFDYRDDYARFLEVYSAFMPEEAAARPARSSYDFYMKYGVSQYAHCMEISRVKKLGSKVSMRCDCYYYILEANNTYRRENPEDKLRVWQCIDYEVVVIYKDGEPKDCEFRMVSIRDADADTAAKLDARYRG